MLQSSQGVISKKKKKTHNNQKKLTQGTLQKQSEAVDIPQQQKTQELHIWDQPISKLYTDDCRRSPIRSLSGNEYIMIAYHCYYKTIMQYPFINRKEKHRIRASNSTMQILDYRGHHVEVQILYNRVSE